MSDSRQPISKGLSPMVTMEIMAAVATIFFVAFILLFFFYLRSKRYSNEAGSTAIVSPLADQDIGIPRGLSPEVIKALPITIFRSDDFKEPLECSVCISELAEGEEVRMLPICSHWFHVECIDMWLHSNSTCPLCRSPVCSEPPESLGIHVVDVRPVEEITGDGVSAESINLPSNVLFWGSGDRVGSSSSAGPLAVKMEGTLVIEIPRGAGEASTSPTLARLRSLRSLLSPTTS